MQNQVQKVTEEILEDLQQSLQSRLERFTGTLSKIKSLQSQVEEKQAVIDSQRASIDRLQSRLEGLEKRLALSETHVKELEAHRKDLQKDLQQKQAELSTAQTIIEDLEVDVEELQKKLSEKQQSRKTSSTQTQTTSKAFKESRARLVTQVKNLEKQVVQTEKEKSSLAQRFDAQPQVDGETWQFQGDSGEWISFTENSNKDLMDKFREGKEVCEIKIDGKTYDISFKYRWQRNQRTKKERKIRCCFGLPSHWNVTDEDALRLLKESLQAPLPQMHPSTDIWETVQKVTDRKMLSSLSKVLNQSLSRHDGTHCDCPHGSSNFVVIEAFQIKNRHVWQRYQRCVRSIRDKHKQHGISPGTISPLLSKALSEFANDIDVDQAGNERLLLHGTKTFEVGKTIASEGFDNRVAKDGLFGKGTYFAAQTCKAAQYASIHGMSQKASQQMPGTMLLARVAIGDPFYTEGRCHTLSRPPETDGRWADSIIARPGIPNGQPGGVQSHMEVVTFDPGQAYPEFIVRFTEE